MCVPSGSRQNGPAREQVVRRITRDLHTRHVLEDELAIHSVGTEGVKNTNLKMYHVMSVKQTLREDLAEHAYQFSCRAADWSRSDFSSVPMRFEPLELHVVDALGQQEVPDYFQQPAKAITEDVSVMRRPYALEWICAVREEIESFKRLEVYEEVPKGRATSTPLPARLILATKPNVHGGPARKKARIVICGNFQEVHPDEFTASKTPSYPSLRMALSVASHMGWPIECWDVSTAFLYARLFGDRDTDLGGNEIFMKSACGDTCGLPKTMPCALYPPPKRLEKFRRMNVLRQTHLVHKMGHCPVRVL